MKRHIYPNSALTPYQLLFYRLKAQAFIQGMIRTIGPDQAWSVLGKAIEIEAKADEKRQPTPAD